MPPSRQPRAARKRVALLHVGALPNVNPAAFTDWVGALPELGIIAEIVPRLVEAEPSVNLQPRHFIHLARVIERLSGQADGFVVLHGLDHLIYTASALAFSLAGLRQPVVVTGGQVAAGADGAGGDVASSLGLKANVINAVQAATLSLPEVVVVFGNRLLRAVQAYRVSGSSANPFDAPPRGVLGRIDFSIRLLERNLRSVHTSGLTVAPLAEAVEYVSLTPWLNAALLRRRLRQVQALLLDARGCAELPAWLGEVLKSVHPKKPVAVLTAHPTVTLALRDVAVLPMGTVEAMHAKLAWATALVKTPAKVAALMGRDVAGEFSL